MEYTQVWDRNILLAKRILGKDRVTDITMANWRIKGKQEDVKKDCAMEIDIGGEVGELSQVQESKQGKVRAGTHCRNYLVNNTASI